MSKQWGIPHCQNTYGGCSNVAATFFVLAIPSNRLVARLPKINSFNSCSIYKNRC